MSDVLLSGLAPEAAVVVASGAAAGQGGQDASALRADFVPQGGVVPLSASGVSGIQPGTASQGAPASQDWLAAMPEAFREALQGMSGPEAALDAFRRGAAHVPLASVGDVKIALPEGGGFNDDTVGWLKAAAVEHCLSQTQLDAVVNGYNKYVENIGEVLKKSTEASLRAEHGLCYNEVMARASDTCRKFNEMTNGEFTHLLSAGLGNHPAFVKFMVAVSEAVSDSALPGTPKGSGDAAMSTTKFLEEVFKHNN